jgi:hypothetical protein
MGIIYLQFSCNSVADPRHVEVDALVTDESGDETIIPQEPFNALAPKL